MRGFPARKSLDQWIDDAPSRRKMASWKVKTDFSVWRAPKSLSGSFISLNDYPLLNHSQAELRAQLHGAPKNKHASSGAISEAADAGRCLRPASARRRVHVRAACLDDSISRGFWKLSPYLHLQSDFTNQSRDTTPRSAWPFSAADGHKPEAVDTGILRDCYTSAFDSRARPSPAALLSRLSRTFLRWSESRSSRMTF